MTAKRIASMKTLLIIVACVLAEFAQAQGLSVRQAKTEVERFPSITTYLHVSAADRIPIKDLTSADFAASVDGHPVDSIKAVPFQDDGQPIAMLLCLDLSGSMVGHPLEAIKKSVNKLLDVLRPTDRMGILVISDSVEIVAEPVSDKGALRTAVGELRAKGTRTALYYGLDRGLRNLQENAANGMKILVVMSDGKNESLDQYKEDDIIELARTSSIPIMAIGYSRIQREYLRSLERIAELTGGNFAESPTDEGLQQVYRTMYDQLMNIYVVRGTIMDMPGDGSKHSLTVTAKRGDAASVAIPLIFPAGVPARHRYPIPWPMWWYWAGGGFLLLAIGGGVTLVMIGKKKKAAREQQRREEELRKNEELEKERQKVEGIERKLSEVESRQMEGGKAGGLSKKSSNDAATVIERPRKERTVILTPETSRQTLRLDIKTGLFNGKRFDIAMGKEVTIGKDEDNGICIPETTISGRHAAICTANGSFVIEDLGSTNGTLVNGQKIERRVITHGDTFKLGKCEGEFIIY
jgi:hypothetical protein